MSICVQNFVFTDLFLEMQCDVNEEKTKNLVLRGNELIEKIGIRVGDRDLVLIVDFLRKHNDVVALEFPYNEITDCGMSVLITYFRERPVIRYLNLVGNKIGPRGISYLISLGQNLSLFTLRLTGNKFGCEGGKLLADLLRLDSGIKFLDLSDTDQTMSSLAYIMTALMPSRGGSKTLQYIDIGRPLPQPYHRVHGNHEAEFIGQVLKDNKVLKELHAQQYGFDCHDIEIMLPGLFANDTLVVLDLNNNNIRDDGVEHLCKYLRTRPPLECLMVGSNNIGDFGAHALSFNLPFSSIRLLDISRNLITDRGMMLIFQTIRKRLPLKTLFFWNNKIGPLSLTYLHRLFKKHLLHPHRTDVKIFCENNRLRAAWNPRANRYTHRFFCELDNVSAKRKRLFIPLPSEIPIIRYRHHVNAEEIGLPGCDWRGIVQEDYFLGPD